MPVMLNAVAISHVLRTLFPSIIEIGPHYSVAGYDVTIVQLAISWLSLLVFASLCIRGVDSTGFFQTILVLALVGSVGVMTGALATHSAAWGSMRPALPSHGDVLVGFLHVLAVAPCAFVGFDTVPQGVEEFAFPYRRPKWIMIASIIAGMLIYIALALLASSSAPSEYGSWEAYAEALPDETGLRALPATFMYARGEGDRRHMTTGAVGTILAILFVVLILVPIPAIGCSMSHEGYICFIAWSALGLLFLLAARRREGTKD